MSGDKTIYKRPEGGWKPKRVTTHPGAVLREDFLKPLKLSANELAMRIGVPATRIGEILHERRAVTPDTAMRLARFFGTSAEIWLRLQSSYDLSRARIEHGSKIEKAIQPLQIEPSAPAAAA